MRILILANNDIGLYKFRKEIIEEFILNGHSVYISVPDGPFISCLKELGSIFVNTKIDRRGINPLKDVRLIIHYIHILKRINPNVVLTYTIKPNIYGGIVCKWKNIPYIANITGLGTAVQSEGILQLITVTMYRRALKKAKTVFFQNSDNEKFFTKKRIA